MSGLQLVPIDMRFMPVGLMTVLDDLAGIDVPAGVELLPVSEFRVSNFTVGWQVPVVALDGGHRELLQWYDGGLLPKEGWWCGRRTGTPAELLAWVAGKFGCVEVS